MRKLPGSGASTGSSSQGASTGAGGSVWPLPSPAEVISAAKEATSHTEAVVRNQVIGNVARDLALVFGVAWFAANLLD